VCFPAQNLEVVCVVLFFTLVQFSAACNSSPSLIPVSADNYVSRKTCLKIVNQIPSPSCLPTLSAYLTVLNFGFAPGYMLFSPLLCLLSKF
jgi:hypothetical protein